ncbi:hypothetical protein HDU67_005464 [Dinochytrium kinnereticum]|nr:hypothetical protein HDU67_005464 [Dinochytrium kinnereticum]
MNSLPAFPSNDDLAALEPHHLISLLALPLHITIKHRAIDCLAKLHLNDPDDYDLHATLKETLIPIIRHEDFEWILHLVLRHLSSILEGIRESEKKEDVEGLEWRLDVLDAVFERLYKKGDDRVFASFDTAESDLGEDTYYGDLRQSFQDIFPALSTVNLYDIAGDASLPPQFRLTAVEVGTVALRDGSRSSVPKKAKEAVAAVSAMIQSEAFERLVRDDPAFPGLLTDIIWTLHFEQNRITESGAKDLLGSWHLRIFRLFKSRALQDPYILLSAADINILYMLSISMTPATLNTVEISEVFGDTLSLFGLYPSVFPKKVAEGFVDMITVLQAGNPEVVLGHLEACFKVLEGLRGDEMMLLRFAGMLNGLIYQHAEAFAPFVGYAFQEGAENMLVSSLLGIQGHPEAFRPYFNDLLKIIHNPPDANTQYAASTALKLLITSTPSDYIPILPTVLTIFLQSSIILDKPSTTKSPTPISAYNAVEILGAFGCVDDEEVATTAVSALIEWLKSLLGSQLDQITESLVSMIVSKLTLCYSKTPTSITAPQKEFLYNLLEAPSTSGGLKAVLGNLVNEMKGISLEAMAKRMEGSFKQLGIDPSDPFFGAVQESLGKEVEKFDCMLSYNWGHQKTVIRIRDSLVARGLTVWLDLEQMAGNVYGKMADAVLGSSVVIPCLTAAYEASGNCKRELGFAADQTRTGKRIVPVRLEQGPFTWSALITAGLLYTQLGEREESSVELWESAMDGLAKEVRSALAGKEGVAQAVVAPKQEEERKEISEEIVLGDDEEEVQGRGGMEVCGGDSGEEFLALVERVKGLEKGFSERGRSDGGELGDFGRNLVAFKEFTGEEFRAVRESISVVQASTVDQINAFKESVSLAEASTLHQINAVKDSIETVKNDLTATKDGVAAIQSSTTNDLTAVRSDMTSLKQSLQSVVSTNSLVALQERIGTIEKRVAERGAGGGNEGRALEGRIASLETTVEAQGRMIRMLVSLLGVKAEMTKGEE